MKIGITGASGVLGKIIVAKLQAQNYAISIFEGDLRNAVDVSNWVGSEKLSYIIHLASKVAVTEVNNDLANAYDINVGGTINLLKAIQGKSIGLFYASSSHVYKSSDQPLSEGDVIEPINSYGLTKHVSELLLNDFSKSNPNLKLCIGRIFSFYHSSQKPPFLYPNLLQRFKNEDLTKPFKLFGANATRDFLNAEEVCDIIIDLVMKQHEGTINIASGKSIKIIDFVKSISPVSLEFEIDENEKLTHLNADITLLNKIRSNNEQ